MCWAQNMTSIVNRPPRPIHGMFDSDIAIALVIRGSDGGRRSDTRTPAKRSQYSGAIVSAVSIHAACGVPVAAPLLRGLEGLDGVHTDPDLTKAVAAALVAPRPDPAQALRHHSWGNRLGDLFSSLGRDLAEDSATPARIEHRPAQHYGRGERRIPG